MSKNTVKPGLTRKRAKRQVENPDFGAFVGRIVRAYGRRVATGDIEALAALESLRSEVDATIRVAVAGLRKTGYSWQEIADRLVVSKQAAQMRFGRDEQGPKSSAVDRRVLDAGLSVSVAVLVTVFADHFPAAGATGCPYCGFRYPDKVSDCPTNATVRPLLVRRRGEDWQAFNRLTGEQQENLIGSQAKRQTRQAKRAAATPRAPMVTESLFATADLTRRESLR